MKISTINVVEVHGDQIIGLTPFTNDDNGDLESKIFFFDLIKEDSPNLLDEEIELLVESDHYVKNDYAIHLMVSTNPCCNRKLVEVLTD